MAINIGNVVVLKSGGPDMTVTGIIGDPQSEQNYAENYAVTMGASQNGDIKCSWFVNGKLVSEVFNPNVLDVV